MVKLYEAWGYEAKLSDWAKMFGIDKWTLYKRIESGMSLEEALSKKRYEHRDAEKWTHNGETHGSREWAEILGITQGGFLDRVRAGLPEEKIFSPVDLRAKDGGKLPTRREPGKGEEAMIEILYCDELGIKPSVATIKASEIGFYRESYKYLMVKSRPVK